MVSGMKRIMNSIAIIAFISTCGKIIIASLTGSIGLLALTSFSGINLITAIGTPFLIRISNKPPDRKHNYGHGKIDNLTVFIAITLLFLISLGLIITAIIFRSGVNIRSEFNTLIYIVLGVSIILDAICTYGIIRSARKKQGSDASEFHFLHFSSDLWCSAIIFLGILLTNSAFYYADSIATIIISLFVIIGFLGLYKRIVEILLDYASEEKIRIIRTILSSSAEISGYSDLKIRTSGSDTMISFKLYFNPQLKLFKAREIRNIIINQITQVINRCDILVHFEPSNMKNIIS